MLISKGFTAALQSENKIYYNGSVETQQQFRTANVFPPVHTAWALSSIYSERQGMRDQRLIFWATSDSYPLLSHRSAR